MTDQEWEELGRRAVACKHWRWMPGMLAIDGTRALQIHGHAAAWGVRDDAFDIACYTVITPHPAEGEIPDLRDPATLGCLLHLEREAWAPYAIEVAFFRRGSELCEITVDWDADVTDDPELLPYRREVFQGTFEEALVAALEAAP